VVEGGAWQVLPLRALWLQVLLWRLWVGLPLVLLLWMPVALLL